MELSPVGVSWKRVCFAPDQERPIRHHTTPEQRQFDGVERFIALKTKRRELTRCQHRGLKRDRHHAFPPRIKAWTPAHRIDRHDPGCGGHRSMFERNPDACLLPRHQVGDSCAIDDGRTGRLRGSEKRGLEFCRIQHAARYASDEANGSPILPVDRRRREPFVSRQFEASTPAQVAISARPLNPFA